MVYILKTLLLKLKEQKCHWLGESVLQMLECTDLARDFSQGVGAGAREAKGRVGTGGFLHLTI